MIALAFADRGRIGGAFISRYRPFAFIVVYVVVPLLVSWCAVVSVPCRFNFRSSFHAYIAFRARTVRSRSLIFSKVFQKLVTKFSAK